MEPRIKIQEIDGSPSGRPRTLKVSNGLLVDNGDGTFTLDTDEQNTVTVAKSGGNYTTIQAALTASGADTLILVYPGTYTDDTIHFTANNQEVRGMGISPASTKVTTTNANICNVYSFTHCRVNRIKMEVTAATTLVHTVLIGLGVTGGTCAFVKCHISMTTTYATGGTQPACIHSCCGSTIKVSEGTIEYNHTGSNVAIAKAPISWEDNDSTVTLELANINITNSGSAFVTGISFGTGTAVLAIDRCVGIIVDPNAGIIAGIYVGAATAGTGGASTAGEFTYNTMHITGGGALATAVYINVAGAVIRGMFNHIHVASSTKNYSYFLTDVASTVNSQIEDIIAVDGVSNVSGTCVFNYVNSPSDGDLSVSGTTTTKALVVTDWANTGSFVMEYKLYRSALKEAYIGYIDCQLVISTNSDFSSPAVNIDTATAQTNWLAYCAASDSYEAWSASGMVSTDVRSIIYIGTSLTRGTVYYYRWRTYKHGDTGTATDYKGGMLCL